ncbi:hypothetical protein TSAR_003874 [Trichomalopsis sarcophagae]|uniref:Uncharacterized protein n=1 Tax=Trichomalopsis sarcophagae TaxID=543379 RepID=A0A232F3H7_9HYME|nr:hypothetical protein TSAR_003874 [Trichomalopsis sarcophagae]
MLSRLVITTKSLSNRNQLILHKTVKVLLHVVFVKTNISSSIVIPFWQNRHMRGNNAQSRSCALIV